METQSSDTCSDSFTAPLSALVAPLPASQVLHFGCWKPAAPTRRGSRNPTAGPQPCPGSRRGAALHTAAPPHAQAGLAALGGGRAPPPSTAPLSPWELAAPCHPSNLSCCNLPQQHRWQSISTKPSGIGLMLSHCRQELGRQRKGSVMRWRTEAALCKEVGRA